MAKSFGKIPEIEFPHLAVAKLDALLIYQTMGIKFDDRWRYNFWLTPIVKTKKKKVYVGCGEISAKKNKLIQVIYVLHRMLVGKNLYKSEKCGQLKVLHLGMWKYPNNTGPQQ